MKILKITFLTIALTLVISAPFFALASTDTSRADFQPIVPIKGVTDTGTTLSFPDYINQLFRISISIGAILAVLMLILGGFEYMTGAKASDKKSGLDRIRGAVIGLVLLLGVFIILNVINPCILEITAFTQNAPSACSTAAAVTSATGAEQTGATSVQITDPDNVLITLGSGTVVASPGQAPCTTPLRVCAVSGGGYIARPEGRNQCTAGTALDACAADMVRASQGALHEVTTIGNMAVYADPDNPNREYISYGGGVCAGTPGTFSCEIPVSSACIDANNQSMPRTGDSCPSGTRAADACIRGCVPTVPLVSN